MTKPGQRWQPPSARIRLAYDPDLAAAVFGRLTHNVQRYLQDANAGPVLPNTPFKDLRVLVAESLRLGEEQPADCRETVLERVEQCLQLFTQHAHRIHSQRYMGHQVPPPVPVGAAFDGIVGVMNQGLAVTEMGPFAQAVERELGHRLARTLGWKTGYASFATGGGSLANLTAILAARNHAYPDCWQRGAAAAQHGAVLSSAACHYSIERAAGILGLGTDAILPIAYDDNYSLDQVALQTAYDHAVAEGRRPFAIVATAPCTPTGSIDPLNDVADFAEANKLWLHVDAVHGAPLLFSERHQEKLSGLQRADSIAWDAHKMMHVPSLATYVLYRHAPVGFAAFQQHAPYLLAEDGASAHWEGAQLTVECTKRALSVPTWVLWATFGPSLFGEIVDQCLALAQEFARQLDAADDFRPLHRPDTNILCFQYLGRDDLGRDLVQKQIRAKILASEKFYITATTLKGQACLRVSLMNPLSTADDLTALLDLIRDLAAEL